MSDPLAEAIHKRCNYQMEYALCLARALRATDRPLLKHLWGGKGMFRINAGYKLVADPVTENRTRERFTWFELAALLVLDPSED